MGIPDSTTQITVGASNGSGGIPVWDLDCGEKYGRDVSSAWRLMRCLWSDRLSLTQHLYGQTSSSGYHGPAAYPDNGGMFVDTVEHDGLVGVDPATGLPTGKSVGPNGMVAYKYAITKVGYRTLDYIADQQLGSLALDYGTQFITVPNADGNAVLKFVTTGNDVTDPPSIPITVVEFVKTVNRASSIPVAAILAAAKAPINSLTFQGQDPGYVIFNGCHTDRTVDTYGNELWNICYKFKFRSVRWDEILNPNLSSGSGAGASGAGIEGPFEQVVYKATGNPVIARSDLNSVLVGY